MDNTWDRIKEREELWFHFKQGTNISMFAPRRLGKSWLMKNLLLKEANCKGWHPVYSDLQNANSYQKAILCLIQDIQKYGGLSENLINLAKAKFKEILQGDIKTPKDIFSQIDPEYLLDAVLSNLNARSEEKPVLIMLDEITICASNIMKISEVDGCLLLNTLRKARDAHPEIRWMLTGSIGIDHFSKQHQVSGAFNNLHPFLIEPFEQEIAIDFVDDCCQHRVVTPFTLGTETHHYLQKRLGWLSPYYLEKLCLKIKPSAKLKGGPAANIADIDKACETLLQHPHNLVFSGWPDHLERNIPDSIRPICKGVLNYLSDSEEGESRDTIRMQLEPEYTKERIREALIILKNDGFLVKDQKSGKFRFVMQLLANYWQEYYA